MDNLQERVISAISEELQIEVCEIRPESSLVEDLGCDSLDLVELIMMAEEDFGIEISDELAERWVTVESIVSTVRLLMAEEEA